MKNGYKLIIEWYNDLPVMRYLIPIPVVGDRNFYRDALTLGAFTKHWSTSLYTANVRGTTLTGRHFTSRDVIDSTTADEFSTIPMQQCTDIRDFYHRIGWCHKTKRFL